MPESLSNRVEAEPRRDTRGEQTVNTFSRYGKVHLNLEKITFAPGEDIPVRIRVENQGYRAFRIYPSQIENETVQFMVNDSRSRELDMEYNRQRHENREHGEPVVNRAGDRVKEILLHPGETYEVTIHINDFYRLEPGQEYSITGYFYPDARFDSFVRTENVIRIRIEEVVRPPSRPEVLEVEPELSPEETIFLFLSAEMRGNRKNYLKYLDLPRYITSYDRFAGRYASARPDERRQILEEFSSYIAGSPVDPLRRFEVKSSTTEADRATVKVEALREAGGYRVIYEYTYTLERSRREGFWQIIHVSARIVG